MRIHLSRIPASGLRQRLVLPLRSLPRLAQMLPQAEAQLPQAETLAQAPPQAGTQPPQAEAALPEEMTAAGQRLQALVTLKNRHGLVQVSGELEADVSIACHRCERWAPVHVAGPVELTLLPASMLRPAHEEVQLSQADLDVSFYEGEEVDLAAVLEDELLLLCPDSCFEEDDQGRCVRCGKTEQEVLGAEPRDLVNHPFAAMQALLTAGGEGAAGPKDQGAAPSGAQQAKARPVRDGQVKDGQVKNMGRSRT